MLCALFEGNDFCDWEWLSEDVIYHEVSGSNFVGDKFCNSVAGYFLPFLYCHCFCVCMCMCVCVCEPWAWGHHQWKHFLRYWPFVRGIHRSPVNSPHKGQWRGALMFSLICAWINAWVNNREAGDLRCHHIHYDVTVMDCPHDNSSPILRYNHQIRTKMQNTLVKIPIVMEIDRPRPLMSMLT